MKLFRTILLGACLLVAACPVSAVEDDVDRQWTEIRQFMKQGAYRDALQSLEVLQQITPDDPRVSLYRSLCVKRLESSSSVDQLSPETLGRLNNQLKTEAREQKRAQAQTKALERQVKREQARWDRELKALERQARREEQQQTRTRRQAEQAAAVARVRVLREEPQAAHEEVLEVREEAPVVRDAAPDRADVPELHEIPRGSVELERVTVTTEPGGELEGPAETPSLAGRPPLPPGAMQINGRQMNVSPDRKVAVADGDVEVIYENTILTCDHLTLFTDTKDVYAEGRVRFEEGASVFRGEMAHYNFISKKGRFLQGTISSPPWHEHGRTVEHVATGVYEVTPGYLTSCELEPPHFKFHARRAIVFAEDRLARGRNVAFIVDRLPLLYLPRLTVADRQTPFFFIPGKKKPWEQFFLAGYRYELPGPLNQKGTLKVDWRRAFGWGVGADHKMESDRWGSGLFKIYVNEEPNRREPKLALPKGGDKNRYRLLWRHKWMPYPDTTMITDIQEFSDKNFRQELLFREEFAKDDQIDSFISVVKNAPDFTVSGLARKRMNRFQGVDELLPQLTFDARNRRIGDTWLYAESRLDLANWQRKQAHSEEDADVQRADWFQQLSYALNWFQPIQVTPRAGVRQTYYTKDIQGSNRHDALRDFVSGQFSTGLDTSLKLFRIFPVATNVMGLNINLLRHVLTPTITYAYLHEPTVPNALLNFPAASGPSNTVTFGLENKLQTKRPLHKGGKPTSVDLARFIVGLPYRFTGSGQKQGGDFGDWSFDLELYPWQRLRFETDWTILSHRDKRLQDDRHPSWNVDLVMVGGKGDPQAQDASDIQAPAIRSFEPGPVGGIEMLPEGQWYLGYGHRYTTNDKNEDVMQFDWRLSPKWQVGSFHRFTWKEVVNGAKRFNNMREYQYSLRRDLHDWIAEFMYRVDREYGEELYLTFTLKAYPEMPVEFGDSYHAPKLGSQTSPFSPLHGQ